MGLAVLARLRAAPTIVTVTLATDTTNPCATTGVAPCSLRDAITFANANAGADEIHFAIGSGPQTITLSSALPAITDSVKIDGSTQPGGSPAVSRRPTSPIDRPLIALDAGDFASGLSASGGVNEISDLLIINVVVGFAATGATTNTVQNCWIGLGPDGRAIDCGGPAPNCVYLASGEHAYLILGRRGEEYLVYNPGNGEIAYVSRTALIIGITTLFAVPTGSAPGAVIAPPAERLPDLRQVPNW